MILVTENSVGVKPYNLYNVLLGASKKLLILKILLYKKAKIVSSLNSITLMKVFVKSNFTVLEVTI